MRYRKYSLLILLSISVIPTIIRSQNIKLETGIALPIDNIPTNLYELGKFGQIGLSYMPTDINNIGVSAQALHIEHHLLFYSAGISMDINSDKMFIANIGVSKYQLVNDNNKFIFAPFVKIQFYSSQDILFFYGECEATINSNSFLSGMFGIGYKISNNITIIGGIHHTEVVEQIQQNILQITGLKGTFNIGF